MSNSNSNIKIKKYFNHEKIKINNDRLADVFNFFKEWNNQQKLKDVELEKLSVDNVLAVDELKEMIKWFKEIHYFLDLNLQFINEIKHYRMHEQIHIINNYLISNNDQRDYFVFQTDNLKNIHKISVKIDNWLIKKDDESNQNE